MGNLAYMSRLGLWGPGSAFPTFDAFLSSMKKRCVGWQAGRIHQTLGGGCGGGLFSAWVCMPLLSGPCMPPGSGFPQPQPPPRLDRGVSFMEMLAMELKGQGLYVSRGLSFRRARERSLVWTPQGAEAPQAPPCSVACPDAFLHERHWQGVHPTASFSQPPLPPARDAEFCEVVCKLTRDQRAQYNAAAGLWNTTRLLLADAVAATASPSDVWKPYYSAVQRFFKNMLVSMKAGLFFLVGAVGDVGGKEGGVVFCMAREETEKMARHAAVHKACLLGLPGARAGKRGGRTCRDAQTAQPLLGSLVGASHRCRHWSQQFLLGIAVGLVPGKLNDFLPSGKLASAGAHHCEGSKGCTGRRFCCGHRAPGVHSHRHGCAC